jgi:hypothetical protein
LSASLTARDQVGLSTVRLERRAVLAWWAHGAVDQLCCAVRDERQLLGDLVQQVPQRPIDPRRDALRLCQQRRRQPREPLAQLDEDVVCRLRIRQRAMPHREVDAEVPRDAPQVVLNQVG